MSFQKHVPSGDIPPTNMRLSFSIKANERAKLADSERTHTEADVDIDLREVYFLIMHFLSAGPCHRTYGQFWNELLEHQLLPRRYHAWYSRSGTRSGDENDDGMSFPLSYNKLVERYPHIEKDHLVKVLKQLILSAAVPSKDLVGRDALNAAAVPTLLGTGSFSLLSYDKNKGNSEVQTPPDYMRWPHMLADQVRGLSLREIGGGFSRHHRAPSVRAASYAIAKPSTMVQRMKNIKKVRGHRNAVYCAIFDRSGRYVITGSDDRLVKIWSMETAYSLASCRGHEGDITDLAVTFNNTLVASASNDFVIRVWRLPDGLPISVLRGHTGAVTAIAFSPRPSSVYQLLSSSDDGTCRIWDARHSQLSPRIYVPKPPDYAAGKNGGPSSSIAQQNHQIFCCAFNASGTVFVTGSSDTLARVWNACKSSTDDPEQPNHEMDVLAGHENDVNYVQFSGCAVASRLSTSDASKDDNIPKFKSSWFNHDNIVTCSRDGSAIIWIPRSRRSHGKVGRWTRAYHLKVPPPPMPPQPPRGGPRQRILPTPRGVNMIVWSLDNRFVLAAIMDCRICVWNAADGSLVHSLTGHTESTYVLDVHPFNPRIAMSAGYDAKTIIWDIWEGTPIRIYETGRFKLVDGKFSPDGTSIILSDDVGQLYILNTGQGESQQDAKYDQFFLGDYRPLIQDMHGNVLDQETQLAPYRRNMQDFLCDSGMIPYSEPYQSMYQRRRLGALGFEWRPSPVRFAVGPDISLDQDYQMLPIADLDILIDPLPEFVDAMDWEPENEVQSDDADSEYHVTEEYSSGGEHGSLCSNSSGDPECNTDDSDVENSQKECLRRSRRKKQKAEVELMTSSGRRVKRKNLDPCDDGVFRNNRTRKLKSAHKASRRKSSLIKSLRPQRAAARNALNLFSRITGTSTDGEDEEGSEGDSSESESTLQDLNIESEESDVVMQNDHCELSKGKEVDLEDSMYTSKHCEFPETPVNIGSRRRLVLKLPNRDSTKHVVAEDDQPSFIGLSRPDPLKADEVKGNYLVDPVYTAGDAKGEKTERGEKLQSANGQHRLDLFEGYKDRKIRWGGVKLRTSKRTRIGEPLPLGSNAGSSSRVEDHVKSKNRHPVSENLCSIFYPSSGIRNQEVKVDEMVWNTPRYCNEQHGLECEQNDDSPKRIYKVEDNRATFPFPSNDGTENASDMKMNHVPIVTKLRIKSKKISRDHESPTKIILKSSKEDSKLAALSKISSVAVQNLNPDEPGYGDLNGPSLNNEARSSTLELDAVDHKDTQSVLQGSGHSHCRMYNVVYQRAKSVSARSNPEEMVASTSYAGNNNLDVGIETTNEGIHRTRHMGLRSTDHDLNVNGSSMKLKVAHDGSEDRSTTAEKSSLNRCDDEYCEEWRSTSRATVGSRSTRTRRSSYFNREDSPPHRRKSHQSVKSSWLMLSTHDEGFRYIPQCGDEVVYLRQGHQEFLNNYHVSRERGPWDIIKANIMAVEYCRVENLEYATSSGSGESCCKVMLKFVDPSSNVLGKSFKIALPEVTNFPDFLVEKTRYDAAIHRNWTSRDKCQVWWKNEGEEDGSWWEGRILAVKPKSDEFPDSPWDRYVVRYKSDPMESHQHSPWELYDSDVHWEPPHIDDESRDKLLRAFAKLEQSGNKNQDYYGVQKLKQVSQKLNFVNRFPVPLSLDVVQSRLENNYYRSLEATEHDFSVMLSNAESYFGRNTEVLTKLRRLSDWFRRTKSSL